MLCSSECVLSKLRFWLKVGHIKMMMDSLWFCVSLFGVKFGPSSIVGFSLRGRVKGFFDFCFQGTVHRRGLSLSGRGKGFLGCRFIGNDLGSYEMRMKEETELRKEGVTGVLERRELGGGVRSPWESSFGGVQLMQEEGKVSFKKGRVTACMRLQNSTGASRDPKLKKEWILLKGET
ncbi:hypothetical protein QQP08_001920 [Theobroma cacao]|nr:hypothetical protein QQP08_001920 [Theobroma cacao]